MKQPTCKYHCRSCECHFTSLAAYDAHKPRNGGQCEWPEKAPLIELVGVCRIGNPAVPRNAVTIYEHESAQEARDHFQVLRG